MRRQGGGRRGSRRPGGGEQGAGKRGKRGQGRRGARGGEEEQGARRRGKVEGMWSKRANHICPLRQATDYQINFSLSPKESYTLWSQEGTVCKGGPTTRAVLSTATPHDKINRASSWLDPLIHKLEVSLCTMPLCSIMPLTMCTQYYSTHTNQSTCYHTHTDTHTHSHTYTHSTGPVFPTSTSLPPIPPSLQPSPNSRQTRY